jgi:hypothetical protein
LRHSHDQLDLSQVEARLKIDEGQVRLEGGKTDIALRRRMANWLLILFSVNTGGALAMIFLVGLGLMSLSDKVIMSVLGATVVEAAAMLVTVTKYLFPAKPQ